MRLYDSKGAPSCARVNIYLAEKGLELEKVPVDLAAKQNRTPEYLAKNPIGKVPLLELDNGEYIPESAAIIEYLEERFPSPTMLGDTPEARARTRATERIASEIFPRLAFLLLHTHPSVAATRPGMVQYPEAEMILGPSLNALMDQLEARLGDNEFLAGSRVTIADCTMFALMRACCTRFAYQFPATHPRLKRWYDGFAKRPSALS